MMITFGSYSFLYKHLQKMIDTLCIWLLKMIIMKEKIQVEEVALERSMSGEDISYVRKKNE